MTLVLLNLFGCCYEKHERPVTNSANPMKNNEKHLLFDTIDKAQSSPDVWLLGDMAKDSQV